MPLTAQVIRYPFAVLGAEPRSVLNRLPGFQSATICRELNKHHRLRTLAKNRQATRWPHYKSIADYQVGVYECDFVSPFTIGAGNVEADVMVLLQDWSSDDELTRGLD